MTYPPPQAGDPYGQPPPAEQPASAPNPADMSVGTNRKPLIVAGAGVLALLMAVTVAYAVYDGYLREDSGVAACKAMRDGRGINGNDGGNRDSKLTEAEYREARELFEDSRHADIREHGTALLDLVWQINQLDDDNEMSALAFIGPMGAHIAGLQTACANQGVIVNLRNDR
ncbi:hypothetical protein [Micromonospora echinofusca]|uniref:Uncharacterized protein n=1 Tax=Micromonospora echinofusca TaxID=47858 RepID=A0ABS3VVX5_MICEH|nr:hypothetical protein [Micromonospora echinofusca]MBO4208692.1 hypothetical protein [Micromonospora echinofusca]